MNNYVIKKIIGEEDIIAAYTIMKQLRPHLSSEAFVENVINLNSNYRYSLVALIVNNEIQCLIGYKLSCSLSWGKYIYVDDLISNKQERSMGYGKLLLDWVVEEGKKQGCEQIHLDSGVQRTGAHRFYLRERMDITCFHFTKII